VESENGAEMGVRSYRITIQTQATKKTSESRGPAQEVASPELMLHVSVSCGTSEPKDAGSKYDNGGRSEGSRHSGEESKKRVLKTVLIPLSSRLSVHILDKICRLFARRETVLTFDQEWLHGNQPGTRQAQ
jgi:hypothetical protein